MKTDTVKITVADVMTETDVIMMEIDLTGERKFARRVKTICKKNDAMYNELKILTKKIVDLSDQIVASEVVNKDLKVTNEILKQAFVDGL